MGKLVLSDSKLAYLSLLPFCIPKFIAGTNILTSDTFFGYRSVGLIFFLYFLAFLLQKRIYLASVVAGIGIFFHPLLIIPNFFNLPAVIYSNFKAGKQKAVKMARSLMIFIPVFAVYILIMKPSQSSYLQLLNLFNREWYEIIRSRDSYLFPSLWSKIEWSALIFYLFLIIVFYNRLEKDIKKIVIAISIVSISIFLINFLLLDVAKIPLIAQLQLVRSIMPLAFLSLS